MQTLTSLIKRGFSPTLIAVNELLLSLAQLGKFQTVLYTYSQLSPNKIRPKRRTNSLVVGILLKLNELQSGEHLVSEIQRLGFSLQKPIWDALIQDICRKERNPEKALYLLQHCLTNCGISPSLFTFFSLIFSFSKLGTMDKAIEALEITMVQKGGVPPPFDNFVCSSIISGFSCIGKPELALRFYNTTIQRSSFKPNVVTYTALIDALSRDGRMEEVHDLVQKMEREQVVFDAVFYSSWIYGYLRVGNLTEAFQKHKLMVQNGLKPDAVSFTILIDGFSREGEVERATGFLNEMKKEGLEPNVVTYTAIMRGFIKRGKLKEAFKMFRQIEQSGVLVDEVTYAILIDGFCRKGDMDQVFGLLAEMEEKRISFGVVTYNTVINGLCKLGRTEEADAMLTGITGVNFMYSTLMHGYIKEGNLEGILEIRKRLLEAGTSIDVVMCNVLIKALLILGAFEDACTLFKQMPEMGLFANDTTYCTLIDGYCRLGRIPEALEIFDEYRKSNESSGIAVYNCIVSALCQEGLVERATDLLNEIIQNGLSPDGFICGKFIKAKLKECGEEGLLEFLYSIDQSKPETLNFLYDNAISILCKRGCHGAASDAYFSLRRKGLLVTGRSMYLLFKLLIQRGSKELVALMLTDYLKGYGTSNHMLNKVLVHYKSKKDVNGALEFAEAIHERSISTLTTILSALIKQGRSQIAYKVLLKAERNGTVLDVVVYSIVVDGLCKEGYLEEALDLCERMRVKNVHPNIVTYNSVLNGLCLQGCLVQAFRLFDSFEKINVLPSIITYSILIDALCKEGYLHDAHELFRKMILKGMTPNIYVYNKLINGYCSRALMDKAYSLLMDMEKSQLVPDAFTISSLIGGYSVKSDMEATLTFYGQYKSRGIFPDLLGFLSLIRGLCTKGRMEEARTVLKDMLQNASVADLIDKAGNEIEVESLANFLRCLADQGRLEAANVLNELGSMLFPSRRFTANVGLTKTKKLERKGTPEEKTVSDAYFSLHEPEKADGVQKVSDHAVQVPPLHNFDDWYSYISSLCSYGNLHKANRVARDLLESLGGNVD